MQRGKSEGARSYNRAPAARKPGMEAGGTVLKAPALVKEVMRLRKDFGVGIVIDGNRDWRK